MIQQGKEMSNVLEIAKNLKQSMVELAAEDADDLDTNEPSISEQLSTLLELQLRRANHFLDLKKSKVFENILDINSRGQAERAYNSYTKNYLLSLGLSLSATAELASSLIMICKKYKVGASEDWKTVAAMDIDMEDKDNIPKRKSVKI
jgi:hypothetical protein